MPVLVRLPAILPGLLALAACSPQPEVVPVRTLDRPTDLAFVCVGVFSRDGQRVLSGRPMRFCRPYGGVAPAVNLRDRRWGTFGLLTSSGRSELAALDLDRSRVADLDPGNFGFGMLPVGAIPTAVAASADGCRAVTLNQGSCDLSLVDTARMLQPVFAGARAASEVETPPPPSPLPVVRALRLNTAAGPLRVRAAELQFLPAPTQALEAEANLCSDRGRVVPGGHASYRALVTLPGCGLVALVELPSGRVLDSLRVTEAGVMPVGAEPTCPTECGGTPEPAVAERPGLRVSALAVVPDGARAYVAAPDHPAIFALDVTAPDPAAALRGEYTGVVPAATGARIPLAGRAVGITRLRLSVQPFATSATDEERRDLGRFVGVDGREFLYAIALDGSVRVLDVAGRATARERECDTQVDTRALTGNSLRLAACHPLPDPEAAAPTPEALPRRLLAEGPGIRPPNTTGGASAGAPSPVDVAFLEVGSRTAPSADNAVVDGSYAYVLYSNGQIMLVNVAPTPRQAELAARGPVSNLVPITHQGRNQLAGAPEPGVNRGPPRVSATPSAALTTNELPFAVRPLLDRSLIPRLEGAQTEDESLHPLARPGAPRMLYVAFPRPDEVAPERWFVSWEGGLPGAGRVSGQVRAAPSGAPAGAQGELHDPGANYCASDVRPGDVVRLFGCQSDADCEPAGRMSCVKASIVDAGLCFPREQAFERGERCARFVASRRRWQVLQAGPRRLALGTRLAELPRPSIAPCRVDADCRLDPVLHAGYVCAEPHPGQGPRCVAPCSDAQPCRPGLTCEEVGSPLGRLCAEGPRLDHPDAALCLADTRNYRVLAGRAFLLSSEGLPRLPMQREEAGACAPLPGRDRRLELRVSIDAPACVGDGAGLLQTAAALAGFPDLGEVPGTCLFRGTNQDEVPAGHTGVHVKALHEGPGVRFVLTNLEQPFGDGATLAFTVEGGFYPQFISLGTANVVGVPARIVASPIAAPLDRLDSSGLYYPYLYLVDAGRVGVTGQRGQLLRANTRRGTFDSLYSIDPFQIQ